MSPAFKKIYSTYKLYIFPSLVGICCIVLIGLIIAPETIKFFTNQQKEKDITARFTNIEAKAAELTKYNEAELNQQTQIVLSLLPAERDFIGSIDALQAAITKSGFSVTNINLSQEGGVKGGAGSSYLIKVDVSGPRPTLSSLISNIENGAKVMKIQSMNIVPTVNEGMVNGVLSIEVFYSPLANVSAAPDAPLPKLSAQEEQLLVKLATTVPMNSGISSSTVSGPKGKENPFE